MRILSKLWTSVLVLIVLFFITIFTVRYVKAKDNLAINTITDKIELGIRNYIEEESKKNNGYFQFNSDNKEYLFKLVKVHTEYLAYLGSKSYFACIDLVDTKGDVYDVDFFLTGEMDNMTVTITTLHKFNGIPYYIWKKNEQGIWQKHPIKGALPKHLGVLKGEDQFEFQYRIKLPKINDNAKMWVPYPTSDSYQEVILTKIKSPKQHKVLTENIHNNKAFFFELNKKDSNKTIDFYYKVKRKEKSAYESKSENLDRYLKSNIFVPIDDSFKKIAKKTVYGKTGNLMRARALYDYTISQMQYKKFGTGWGKGDSMFACDAKRGNCTDYHSYFISLARAIGIPARFAIGAGIPSSRNDGGVDGYHCWVEFYADKKWWPIDISEADKYSSLATYYFGHHPANRFEFSKGRDLVFEPGPKSGPINFLAYPVLEVAGNLEKVKTKFYFKRKKTPQT